MNGCLSIIDGFFGRNTAEWKHKVKDIAIVTSTRAEYGDNEKEQIRINYESRANH